MEAKYAAVWQYVNLSIIQQAKVNPKNKKKLEKVLDLTVDWCYNNNVETDKRDFETIKNECLNHVKCSPIVGWLAWILLRVIIEQIIIAVLKRIINANQNSR